MDEITSWCREHGITEVEAFMPDMSGVARGKIMPATKYCKQGGIRLPEALILQTVTGGYPEDWSTVHPTDRDMWARGDASTIRMVPWAAEPTAQVIHDCFHSDGSPVEATSRHVLRRVLEAYTARGWHPLVAPELEFYLVERNVDADYPLEAPVGRSGRAETGRQAFGIDALNEFAPVIDDIYDFCEAQNIELDTVVHESGSAQMEFNLEHGHALVLADQAFLVKRTVREAALRRDMYATFMAKPMESEPGSSMHLHQSLTNAATGENIFNAGGQPSALFTQFIAGQQKYLPAAMALLAPNVNSYRRIAKYESAPINTHWGFDNRTVGLRVPIAAPAQTRVENRLAGADANPYLAMAASLACGYLGIAEQLEPEAPLSGSAYEYPYGLPRGLEEALRLFSGCTALREVLGERFVDAYCAVKEAEYEAFSRVISSWEREYLLLNV